MNKDELIGQLFQENLMLKHHIQQLQQKLEEQDKPEDKEDD